MTLFRYDSASHVVVEVIENKGPDIRSASAGPGGIIYEQFGQIVFYDFKTKGNNAIPITVDADLSEIRPRTQSVGGEAHFGRISPTGVRAVFEAHGDVFTVPAEKGDIRNLTHSPGVMERTPAWSPDGSSIAYLSDDSGEYSLHVLPESGEGSPKRFALGRRSVFYSAPQWSPDSTTIALSNNQLEIILVDVASGTVTMVDTDYFYPYGDFDRDIAWSPDSKWIAYSKILPNHLHAINLYSALTQKSTQVSDGMSDARFPAFDRNGLYLYYAASTDYGPSSYGLDMTSAGHRITRVVYATVLSSRSASPVIPLSDEESPNHGASSAQHSSPALGLLQIDLDDLSSRTVALPISPGDVRGVFAGASGQIYILKNSYPEPTDHNRGNFLLKFDLATRRQEVLAHDVDDLDVSNDGKKMLLSLPGPNGSQNSRRWLIAPTSGTVNVTAGILDLGTMEMRIDPQAEWKQMYREVWRIERAFFYDPNLHGLDSVAMEKMYEPHVESLTSRDDLNYIFQEMLAEVLSSHLRGGGGTIPRAKRVPGGLLGADYRIDHDLYRIQHIYKGQAWDPELRAPLSGPGVDVKEGEYLFEVNGHELSPDDDVNAWLEGTAGKRVVIRVGPEPNEATSREVTVFPVASEVLLRNSDWIESNRRRVDRLSAGRLAYVYMPNTAEEGLSSFNRLFYAQVQKEGLILDERYNSGGQVADYVIGVLNQPLLAWTAFRYGAIQKSPSGSIQGPKVLLINETAGSGGDMLAWMFRYANVGTLVGKRTWGGLTGILAVPQLMDGGYVTAPTMRLFDPEGQWIVENSGVRPDVEVEFDPRSVDRGGDPQIERAVSIALEKLKSNPQGNVSHPTYPNFQSNKPEEKRRENR
jgi:tricorn protease